MLLILVSSIHFEKYSAQQDLRKLVRTGFGNEENLQPMKLSKFSIHLATWGREIKTPAYVIKHRLGN